MNNLDDAVSFVKTQVEYQDARASHFFLQGDEVRANSYKSRADNFLALKRFINNNYEDKPTLNSIYITPDDLVGLPPELIQELNISESDRHEFFIMNVIEKLGGVASIDKIIIGAYRATEEILERPKLNAKLYRMASKGLIFSHPSKKGVYSTKEMEEERDTEVILERL